MIGNNTSGTDAPSEVSTNVSGIGRSHWAGAVEQTVKNTVEMDQRNKVKGIAPSLSKDGLEVTRVQKKKKVITDFIDLSQSDDKIASFGMSTQEPVRRSKSRQ